MGSSIMKAKQVITLELKWRSFQKHFRLLCLFHLQESKSFTNLSGNVSDCDDFFFLFRNKTSKKAHLILSFINLKYFINPCGKLNK